VVETLATLAPMPSSAWVWLIIASVLDENADKLMVALQVHQCQADSAASTIKDASAMPRSDRP
jgi:hypothetical protein